MMRKLLITAACLPAVACLYGQPDNLYFSNLSIESGLSHKKVSCIAQDSTGYMWFGTAEGLDRYDGYDFRVYKHDPSDTTSISASWINCLHVTRAGELWVGTEYGVNVYDPSTERFIRCRADNDERGLLNTLRIKTILEDSHGTMWIGTFEGLIKYDRAKNYINFYVFSPGGSGNMANEIRAMCQQDDRTLWIGTFDGLYRFNIQDNSYERFEARSARPSDTFNNLVDALHMPDPQSGILYVGTSTGVTVMDTRSGAMRYYRTENSDITDNDIRAIASLDDGTLLIATANGLSALDLRKGVFRNYNSSLLDGTSLPSEIMWCVCEDRGGVVWFGTDNGVARINKNRKKTDLVRIIDERDGMMRNVMVNDILVTPEGEYWLTTNDGILRYGSDMALVRRYGYTAEEISHPIVKKILMDSRGIIWIGTNDGLNYYDARQDRFVKVAYSHEGFVLKYIYDLAEDGDGDIVVNISSGICFITPRTDARGAVAAVEFRTVMVSDMIEADNSDVCCFHTSGDGNIWIGTINAGLLRYEKGNGNFTHYKVGGGSGIISNRIYSVSTSTGGDVWVGTDLGLCRLDTATGLFTGYGRDIDLSRSVRSIIPYGQSSVVVASVNKLTVIDEPTGDKVVCDLLQELSFDEISYNCFALCPDGNLVIGGNGGLVVLDPLEIGIDRTKAPVVISSFALQGHDVYSGQQVDGKVIIGGPLHRTGKIKLDYTQNTFRLGFALLNYATPETNRYSYILEGYDTEWMQTGGGRNYASYSNLPPGRYRFTVVASNPDGVWSDAPASMDIVVMPPWWKTWWACTIYFIVFGVVLGVICNMLIMRMKLSAELGLEKLERAKMEELNQIKMRFFTNISHEFKTPLSLMLGPVEELQRGESDEKRNMQFSLIKKNGERLLRLINQIMDMRKYDNGVMLMDLRRGEYVGFAEQIFNHFREHAARRGIDYTFEAYCDKAHMFFDHDKMEKVVFNLLSNAFKFAPDGSHIAVSVAVRTIEGRPYVETAVADTGCGIPSGELPHIFDRFYQGTARPFERIAGTGIGLGLTKDYIEQHGGEISAQSGPGSGSVFTFRIPCDLKGGENAPAAVTVEVETPQEPKTHGAPDKMKVLAVDDNEEILQFIRLSLEDVHDIITALDGRQALDITRNSFPDVVLADVMMPGMDGLELCRAIKNDIITCHIPVILLTAKTSEEDRAEGYGAGADGYISKPFSVKTLKAKINAMAERSEKLRQRYKYMQMTAPAEIKIESDNDRFISEMLAVIEKNIDNAEFGIQDLCSASRYSYQQIYRKVRALTGESINEFIRTVRLKRAAQYLERSDLRISEIMYNVGFSSHSYFTKCFREHFGLSPREYAEKHRAG